MATLDRNTYVNQVLTDLMFERQQSLGEFGYIANKIMPALPTKKNTGIYYISKATRFRVPDKNSVRRGPMSPTATLPPWSASTDTYKCEWEALQAEIPMDNQDEVEDLFDLEVTETERVNDQLMLLHETSVRDIVTNASIYPTGHALTGTAGTPGANEFVFFDDADGEPLKLIEELKIKLLKGCGHKPNTLVIGENLMSKFVFLNKFTTPYYGVALGIVRLEQMKELLQIDNILVPSIVSDDTVEGSSTENLDFVWGNMAWLGYVPPSPGLRIQAFGYTFSERVQGTNGLAPQVKDLGIDESAGNGVHRLNVQWKIDRKVVNAACGILLQNVVQNY